VNKYWCILLLFVCLLGLPANVAASEPAIVINGESVEFNNPPVLKYGRIMVPMREMFTNMGAEVYWDNETNTAVAAVDNAKVTIPVGSYLPTINDVPVAIDVPVMVIRNCIYVPLRFAAESLGGHVNWEAEGDTAFITTAAAEAAGAERNNLIIVNREEGMACWYGDKFHGKMTSSGEVYDKHLHTAAHRTLPFGTIVKVTFPLTGRSVWVRINDRGPHVPDRIIDLSHSAADAIGLTPYGIGWVQLEVAMESSSTTGP